MVLSCEPTPHVIGSYLSYAQHALPGKGAVISRLSRQKKKRPERRKYYILYVAKV